MINIFEPLKSEIKILSKFKMLWAAILVTNIFMIVGINFTSLSDTLSLNVKMSSLTGALGSSRYGALAGALAFSSLSILILSRDNRNRFNSIIYSAISEKKLLVIRLLSIIFYVLITTLMGMIFTMVTQIIVYKVSVHIFDYLYCYAIITFLGLIFSVFIATGLYLFSNSTDISILSMIILFFISLLSDHYLFNWAQTGTQIFSDFAGMRPVSKLIIYNRLLWISISISFLLLGLLLKRQYSENIFKSFIFNLKSIVLLPLTILAISCSIFIYVKEPYNMNVIPNTNKPTVNEDVILKRVHPEVTFDNINEILNATVSYEFENNNSNSIQFCINEGLKIKDIKVNNKPCTYKKIADINNIEISIPNEKNINVDISYEGQIKYYNDCSVAGYICQDSIYLLEESNWIFRPLTANEKTIDIEGYYIAPNNLCVITPGKTTDVKSNNENTVWNFQLKSQDLNIGAFAAKYNKSEFSINGTKIEFYYSPKHEEYIKNHALSNDMNIEAYMENMFKYYSDNIGSYYSNEYPLKIVESSIYKTGGHSSGNVITFAEYMLNRGNTSIPQYTFLHDLNIIAHEISHQWWGTGVSLAADESFSNEGLAEYSSYKYMQNEFKNSPHSDFVNSDHVQSWQHEVNSLNRSYYFKSSKNLGKLNKNYRVQFELKNLKIQRYDFMPLELYNIEKLHGSEKFMNNLSKVYKNNLYQNLTYEEFLNQMEISKEALSCD